MITQQGSAWALLAERDFARFCSARFLSGSALQMQNVAVGWLIYDWTHSALALGMAGLSAFLPAVGLVLVAGHVADNFDRRRIVAAVYGVQVVTALGLLVCSLVGPASLPYAYAMIVLTGGARSFGNPASQALLPILVGRQHFARAMPLAATFWQTATILGPVMGGLLYILGPHVVFATVAAAVSGGCLAILSIRHRAPPRERQAASWSSLVAGIGFVTSRPILLGAISLDLFAVLLGGATALLPIYAQTVLETGPWGLGILRAMPGAGAVAMSTLLATRPIQARAGRKLFVGVATFGLATIGFGLSTSLWISMACLFCVGASDTISVVVRQTLVQAETPDEMRGRVAAVNSIFIGASNELGEFESGMLAAWLGAVRAVVLGGIGTIAVAGAWTQLFPELWRRDQLVE